MRLPFSSTDIGSNVLDWPLEAQRGLADGHEVCSSHYERGRVSSRALCSRVHSSRAGPPLSLPADPARKLTASIPARSCVLIPSRIRVSSDLCLLQETATDLGAGVADMTGLTNEQVFAELYFSKKAIKEVTGVTVRCWRPPYGDVDDRVRYIASKLDMRTVVCVCSRLSF